MGDFLGSPVARTLQSQCREPGFDPWLGNYIPHATTKTHLSKKKKKKVNIKKNTLDFSGGTVNKNPPANAGDTGSILGSGRFYRQLSPRSAPTEAECLETMLHSKSHCSEKPVHHTHHREQPPTCWGERKPTRSNEDPAELPDKTNPKSLCR